ncbi:unnamed protein product [Symbiodinium natans]|uniref:Cytochrome b561 domain-containing protein n=1 Tax=Symbiodinium natans TaxID=878477 RepID=A0A812HYJ6_9DINO|nr:unnamed protein product [Symbiodinium natans]
MLGEVVNVAGGLVLTAFYYNFTAFEVYIMSLFWAGIISIPLYQVKISIIDVTFSLMLRETYRVTRVMETNPPQDSTPVLVSKLPRLHWLHVDEPESRSFQKAMPLMPRSRSRLQGTARQQQELRAFLAEACVTLLRLMSSVSFIRIHPPKQSGQELMSSSALRRDIEEKGKEPVSSERVLKNRLRSRMKLVNGLFFLAALLVPLAVIWGLLGDHPGGGLKLSAAFAWHPILMSIAFPCLMVLGRWAYVTDLIEEKGLRRTLHGSIMALAALVALGGYAAMFKAHWPIKQYFGYNFTTHEWTVPARVIHDLIGYSILALVLFQATIGMAKIVKLQNKIKSFTFHGTLGKVIMILSAVNILVACVFWKWTAGYKILVAVLAVAATALGVLTPSAPKHDEHVRDTMI